MLEGSERLTNEEFKKFTKGDSIRGNDVTPTEIKRWSIEDKEEALAELSKYKCSYERYNEYLYEIKEYALEYCQCDEDGEFIEGSDYDYAEAKKVKDVLKNIKIRENGDMPLTIYYENGKTKVEYLLEDMINNCVHSSYLELEVKEFLQFEEFGPVQITVFDE